MKFIDLFSGIGGFRLALEKFGYKCIFSADNNPYACETYYKNFKEYPLIDIKKLSPKKIPNHDILCAGFPCQPFSIAGKRKGFDDTRGTLFFDIVRILKEKKPKVFNFRFNYLWFWRGIINIINYRKFPLVSTSRGNIKKF